MESATLDEPAINGRIAARLRDLRSERGWSLDELAARSGASRATLSRLENGEVSPTVGTMGRLCAAFGLPMSRLILMVEQDYPPVMRAGAQPTWRDAETGFTRRSVSPPAQSLAGEVLECRLEAGTRIAYDAPPRPGLEHHLVIVDGVLEVAVDGARHRLEAGDCLRYRLDGPSAFVVPGPDAARYMLFLV